MPHINRIRVNNVKYNFGTQFYDDFIMRFSGKNTIYDLANGGGKSVLMLLLLQNMIPNCTLDDKQPIEKLFRTGSGSNTIHSLVEWKLSDVHVKNNFKYMLTGFCARKARDEEKNEEGSASIDYFNYVIFYRDYNDNDIKNLPLSVPSAKNPKVKERITYNGLKNYLRDLEKKDFNLEIKIFEKKGDYQRFIAKYGIYESEWEIIRGINKTEGHVRTYFESNYKTTRKVVEDLLIEEIIEKSFKNRVLTSENVQNHENVMVETLIEIKDKLLELSARKDEIQNYDRQVELLDSFVERIAGMKKLYFGQENLERELAASYFSLQDYRADGEERRQELDNRLVELQEKILEEQRAIDTVQIQENEREIQKLREVLEELSQKEEMLETEEAALHQELVAAESMNDYLDYLYYKRERDAIREHLERRASDKGTLMQELAQLAVEKKARDARTLEEIRTKIEAEEEKTKREQTVIEELQAKTETLTREKTISEYRISQYEQELNAGNEEIAEKKQSVNLLLVYDLKKEIALADDKIRSLSEEEAEKQQNLQKNAEIITALEEKIRTLKEQTERYELQMEENISRRMELASGKTRMEKLKNIYGEKSSESLLAALQEKLQDARSRKMYNEQDKAVKTALVQRFREGCPVGGTEEVQQVLDYIQRFHQGNVVAGSELLKSEEPQKRQELLERAPMLPYAVVVYEQYAKINGDTGLQALALGNHMVPILDGQALVDGDYFVSEHVTYAMCSRELFYEEKLQLAEIAKLENEILELERQLTILNDNLVVYQNDLEFTETFLAEYQQELEQLEEAYQEFRLSIKENEVLAKQAAEEMEQCKTAQVSLETELEALRSELENQHSRKEMIEQIAAQSEAVKNIEKQLTAEYEKQKSVSRELVNVTERCKAWQNKEVSNRKMMDALKSKEHQILEQWESYRRYYREDMERSALFESLSDDEIESAFRGAAEAFEGEMGDVADKQKLLENYEIAMEKSLQAIDYKGMSVTDISARYVAAQCQETTKEELVAFKQKIEQKQKELKEKKSEVRKVRSQRDKLEGAVNHGKEAIIQKYGTFEPVEYGNISAEEFICERQQVIANIGIRTSEIKDSLKQMSAEEKKFELLIHDMERVLTAQMKEQYAGERYEVTENLQDRVEKALEAFEQFHKEIEDRKESFEKEKNQMIQTLHLMKCAPLADELRENALMPQSVRETEALTEDLKEIINCLVLEKERISKSILDMEAIKENFESQCIQSCVNIKTELEKLPKLSRIVMDGESIPIISLNIPYVPEQDYKNCMAEYINETVRQADEMKSEADRVKFIKNQLSWKRLFAVIVTDMNAIRMNLYKRERMKEQSRYLKYEEAVGSTGQSQGIYIQFLIAVINYISSINSRDADSTSLLKVVFIDNPFGAAKDIYIWEPIFKMLKTNNVQLVVPCRGATPAITGRFDVNYVLGQKLIDGKQQTVVVDYYSNVDSDKLDYTTMTYEQESLVFLQ